jgi:hypothetical protein
MKRLRMVILLGLAMISGNLLITCDSNEQNNSEGSISFGIAAGESAGGLKSDVDSTGIRTHYVIVTLANRNGELVLDHEVLRLYNFSGYWLTEEIRLKTGAYNLLEFLVADADGNVIYAAPKEGSPKAYLVNDPLPIRVEVSENQVSRVLPEVLAVNGEPPESFGYLSFGYTVVQILDLFIAAYIDNPLIEAPTRLTEAMLEVRISPGWAHSFKLMANVNRITLPLKESRYLLTISKEGYEPVEYVMSPKELMETSPENPLMVPLKLSEYHILRLKPGPQEGIDATVFASRPDENFGNHPCFEAAMAPPYVVYDHKEISRSLIRFDLGSLPKSATIRKVDLVLFYRYPFFYDSITDESLANLEAVLQRVISPWSEDEVTWNTQPETTEEGQVFLTARPWVSANFYTIDVTELFIYNSAGILDNSGIMFKLIESKGITGFSFASSDNPEPALYPELAIQYTLP